MSDDLVKVAVSEGKYTFGQRKDGSCYALRHGEPWREGIFDGMTLAMAYRIEELEAKLAKAENGLFTLSHIHDGNPSDARADILPLDYARHMLWEARSIARTTLAELKGETDE